MTDIVTPLSIPNTRLTDTHAYFLNGPFSQWYKSPFMQSLSDELDAIEFNCAEQFMMAGKAYLFNDEETLDQILKTSDPRKQKALGRVVKNFDADVWNAQAKTIVYRGNIAKFTQNDKIKNYLLSTETRKLVEGASYDTVWGVGLDWTDDAILNEDNWNGTNWLGEVLMQVRSSLQT